MMMRLRWYLLLCVIPCFFGNIPSLAQKVKILEEKTELPVPFASIFTEDFKKAIQSGENGIADLRQFEVDDILVIRHQSYREFKIVRSEIKSLLYLQKKDFELDAVVISSSHFAEFRSEVAQKIATIDLDFIENSNAQTSADILSSSGYVFVQKSQLGGGSPVIRGFEANRVLLVADGVRLNNAIYRSGHLQNSISLSTDLLENVEVIYGPGSVIYGSDAIGGVIHYHTRDPEFAIDNAILIKGGASYSFSSANKENGFSLHFNSGGKKVASLTGLSYSIYDHLRKGDNKNPFFDEDYGDRNFFVEQINGLDSAVINEDPNKQIFSGYKQFDLLQKLSVIVNPNWTQNFNIQYSRSSNVPRYDRLTRIQNGEAQYAEWYYGPQERLLISSESVFLKKRKLFDAARVNLAFQKVRESRHNRRFRSAELTHRNETVDVISANADFKKVLGTSEIKYGTEYIYNDVKSTAIGFNTATNNSFAISTRYPAGGSYTNSGGLYISHKWTANENLILSQAIRLNTNVLFADLVDTSFFPLPVQRVRQSNISLSGGIGAIYKAGKNWRISSNIGSGFRAPNVDDISKVFESIGGTVIVPNADLKPERIYSFDIGTEGKVREDISLDVSTFFSYLTDVIVIDDFRLNSMDSVFYDGELSKIQANQNKQEAYLTGLSFGVNVKLSERMKFNFKSNYTYGRVVTDSTDVPLDHIPPIFGRGGISYSIKKLNAEFYVHYNAWKRKKNYSLKGRDNFEFATEKGMPAWMTFNFRLNYELSNDLRFQFVVENVTDYNYRVFASGISGPGINFIFNIRKNF